MALAADGGLDPSLDGDGIRILDCSLADDFATDVAVQPDGKLVVVGPGSSVSQDFCIARLNPDGSPDSSFGAPAFGGVTFDGDGRTLLTFGGVDVATAVAVQADGKIVVVGTTSNTGAAGDLTNVAVARLEANGTRDTSVGGGDGLVDFDLIPASDFDDVASDVAIAPTGGSILVAVHTEDGNQDFGVARVHPANGFPDAGYGGGDGVALRTFGLKEAASAIVIQSDGKAVVAGESNQGATTDFAAARFNEDGTNDQTWGEIGERTIDFGDGDRALDMIPYNGGFILAGVGGSGTDFALARLDGGGDPDTAFNGDGKATVDHGAAESGQAVTATVDGKLLMAGTTAAGGLPSNIALAKFTPNGDLDPSFSDDGVQITDLGSATEFGASVVREATGSILVAGRTGEGSNPQNMALVRYSDSLPTVSVGDASGAEGGQLTFPITMNKTSGVPVNVTYGSADGSAIAGADYAPLAGTVTFNPGETSGSAATAAMADNLLEPAETFGLGLLPPTAATLADGQAAGTITNVLLAGKCVNVLIGTSAAETLDGSAEGDLLDGAAGGDRLNGLDGNDCLRGRAGNDRLSGGNGVDSLQGHEGNDNLNGGAGNDTLSGGAGKNKMSGSTGNDKMSGGSGADSMSGGTGDDRMAAGSGNDKLSGGTGKNTYSGGSGNDAVSARNGRAEKIDCGSGSKDTATVDRNDTTKGCETVKRPRK